MASVVMMSFQSCGKDKKDEPKAKLPNEISGVITTDESLEDASVYAVPDNGESLLGEAKITGKKFNLKFKSPADKDLVEIGMKQEINISDRSAKVLTLKGLFITKGKNKFIGTLLCSDTNPTTKDIKEKNTIDFIYVDRPFKITGTVKDDNKEFVYNLDFKKGWNTLILHVVYKNNKAVKVERKSVSSIPSNYKWYLELQEND